MASTINASTSAGLVTTADTSGVLVLQSNGTTALSTSGANLTAGGLLTFQATTLPTAGTASIFNRSSDSTMYLQAATGGGINLLDGSQNSMATLSSTSVQLLTGNTARVTVISSGFVGVGTGSPQARLQVLDALKVSSADQSAGNVILGDGSSTSFNVGIGRWNGSTNVAGTGGMGYFSQGTVNSGGHYFYTGDAAAGSTTERARIAPTGKVIFNATAESGTADSVVTIKATGGVSFARALALETHTTASVIVQTFRNPNGQVGYIATDGSTTQYSTSSDYRLKESVQPMTGALAKVALLKPVTYKWKVDGSDGQGFIAHELAEVVPNCVFGEKDGTEVHPYEISPAVPATFDEEGNVLTPSIEAVMGEREVPKYQGIDTSFLVATLTAAIQELKAIVDAQGAEIAALKGASA